MRVYHRAAVEACERAGDLRGAQRYRGSAGYACLELGAFDEAVRELRDVLEVSRRLGLQRLAAVARQNLGLALAHAGALDDARAEEGRAVQDFLESGNRRMEAASRYYLGWIRLMAGDAVGAEKSTRTAVEMAAGPPLIPAVRAEGLGILAAILLARGRADEAREAAAEGKRLLDELGGIDGGESMIRLSDAETRHATGDVDGARAAIASARDRLHERAQRIGDPALRASFLERVPENARTLALATAWLA
jgi:tetratricopeptide (TPR) repeat protein